MKFSRQSRNGVIVAECGAELRAQAETLLRLAAESDAEGPGLGDGSVIEYGWAPLKVQATGEELALCEPDYVHDPNQFLPTVDGTLRVLAAQSLLLAALGIEGIAAKYDQGLVARRGALAAEQAYLLRRAPVSDRDSGWYAGLATDKATPPDSELEPHFIYALFARRRTFMQVLALPYDYLAVFEGDELAAVLDPHDRRVWP